MGANEYWMITLPAGQRGRNESMDDAINRELTELLERGWDVHSFQRERVLAPATFLMRKPR